MPDHEGHLSEEEIAETEQGIAEVTGTWPEDFQQTIHDEFTVPGGEELDQWKLEDHEGETESGTDSGAGSEPDHGTQSQPDPGFTPPLENYAPRRNEPFTPRPLPEDLSLESYNRYILEEANRSVQHSLSEQRNRELDERVETSEAAAKRAIPDYSAVVDGYVVPACRADYRVFLWLRDQPNPAIAALNLGRQLRDHAAKQSNFRPTVRGRSRVTPGTGRVTAEMINQMSPEEFIRQELEPFKNSGGE